MQLSKNGTLCLTLKGSNWSPISQSLYSKPVILYNKYRSPVKSYVIDRITIISVTYYKQNGKRITREF